MKNEASYQQKLDVMLFGLVHIPQTLLTPSSQRCIRMSKYLNQLVIGKELL